MDRKGFFQEYAIAYSGVPQEYGWCRVSSRNYEDGPQAVL